MSGTKEALINNILCVREKEACDDQTGSGSLDVTFTVPDDEIWILKSIELDCSDDPSGAENDPTFEVRVDDEIVIGGMDNTGMVLPCKVFTQGVFNMFSAVANHNVRVQAGPVPVGPGSDCGISCAVRYEAYQRRVINDHFALVGRRGIIP